MATYGAIETLKGSMSILFDESATGFEKLGAVIALGSAAMQAWNAVNSASAAIIGFKTTLLAAENTTN